MDLKKEIQEILSPPHELFKIINRFEDLSKAHSKELLAEAESWLLKLYELDAHFFGTFLRRHVPQNNSELIREVYLRAEKDNIEDLFRAYYRYALQDEINQAVAEWIKKKLNVDEITRRFRLRYRYSNPFILSEASCIALYEYRKEIWEKQLLNDISHQNANMSFEEGRLENFRALVRKNLSEKNKDGKRLYQALLRRFGTEDEKHAENRRIIEGAASVGKTLEELNGLGLSPNEEELELIQARFPEEGEKGNKALFGFLMQYSESYARNFIESEVAKAKTEAQMEEIAGQLRQKAWQRFYQLADSWILKVYELAPAYCRILVEGYNGQQVKMSGKTAAELLRRVQRTNHRDMLRFVYSHLYNNEEWNKAILDVVNGSLPQREITNDLTDLDCQPRYVYHGQKRAYLKDEVAAAVFEVMPGMLYSFILPNLAPNTLYPQLLQVAEGTEAYFILFREFADGDMWKAAMKALLERDIPAEDIVTELERYQLKRHTSNGASRDVSMDAGVLKGFAAKYGEAVLPFFERYVSWVTEGRLKSLLTLEIDRAELLRELNVIARREPQAFSSLSNIWALPLYERGASFFESFLIRYIGRGNEYLTRQLMSRAKEERQINLFRALYRLIVRGGEWEREIARFLDSKPSMKDLADFLELYDIPNWDYTLHDSLAATLYSYNPELGLPFLLRHLGRQQRWGSHVSYNSLLKATEGKAEDHLVVLKNLAYERYWKSQIEALLGNKLSGEEALGRLQELHPRNSWEIQDTSLLKKVFEKYGADVAPYMVEHIHWLKADEKFMQALEKNAPSSLFWDAVFATIGTHGNNGWSYKRWTQAIEALLNENLSDEQVKANLEMLSPVPANRWTRYEISEALALSLYRKYPNASKGFLQRYFSPRAIVIEGSNQPVNNLDIFGEALQLNDEEMLDYLSFCAMGIVNGLIYRAFPPNPKYQRADKKSEAELKSLSEKIIQRFEALYQREPNLYVRHVALTLAWWRPFAIWNAKGMEEHNPIYKHFITAHLEAWMESDEALREVLESPNIFVQLIALKLLNAAEHPLMASRILENKRIFRQILLGRARTSTKRLALAAIEKAIAAHPASASELLPILEEAADFYGRLALSEQMMISITRIRHALEEGGIYAG